MSGSRWITSTSHHVDESKVTHKTTKTEARNITLEEICTRKTTEAESKQYYDVKTKSLRPLAKGSTVRIQRGKSWNSMAQVMKKADTPRSYILQDETGRLLRRNRRDLLRTDESFIGKGPQDLGDNEV
jgi:hypothetical protein